MKGDKIISFIKIIDKLGMAIGFAHFSWISHLLQESYFSTRLFYGFKSLFHYQGVSNCKVSWKHKACYQVLSLSIRGYDMAQQIKSPVERLRQSCMIRFRRRHKDR